MKKALFLNTTSVSLQDKRAGEEFSLKVFEDGKTPTDIYWRKRLKDNEISLKSPEEAPASPASGGQSKANRKGK